MTNDKFKPTFKLEPNVPKTYEQFVLEDKFEQNQEAVADSYAAELGAYGDIGIQKGYGPCTDQNCVCYIEQGFVSLHLACPATNCTSSGLGEAYQWVHGSNCGGPIYINGNADLKCMTCQKQGYITNWSFRCSEHPGEYLETTNDDCINALGTVLRLYPSKPDAVKRVVRRVITKLMDNEGYTAGSSA